MAYERKKDGLYIDHSTGRTMEHKGYATRIHWNGNMITFLRRHFATTLNEELADCLGVSPRTMIRKARELGLEKDPVWLRQVWEERRMMAHVVSRRKGYPGGFEKGRRYNPAGEFKKGHQLSPEAKAKQSASIKRWNLLHPQERKARGAKIWATRRANQSLKSPQSVVV